MAAYEFKGVSLGEKFLLILRSAFASSNSIKRKSFRVFSVFRVLNVPAAGARHRMSERVSGTDANEN